MTDYPFLGGGPILMIILAAVVTTSVLGFLLKRLGTYSEVSKRGRFVLLTLLTFGVGSIIFTLVLAPSWIYSFAIAGVIIFHIGFLLLWWSD